MFAHFTLPDVNDVARRTVGGSLVVGLGLLIGGFSFGYLLFGIGAAIGLGMGVLNLRLIGRSVKKVAELDTENKKRPLAVNTVGRMGLMTVVAFVLIIVSHQLGTGVLIGLVAFQLIMLANAARSMAKSGPMTSVDEVITANVIDDELDGPVLSESVQPVDVVDDGERGS
jgi:hypothetical protein